jgi:glucose 1-dehydrogenase
MTENWLGLENRNAVVTGAGSGIGRGIALELARHGCRIFVLDLDEAGAKETVERIRSETDVAAVAHGTDTSDPGQVAAAADRLHSELGPADVLVNNAGIIGSGELTDVPLEQWSRVFAVNVTGYLLCAREFGRDMLAKGRGSVVHVASICGAHAYRGAGAYSSTKAAVSMLSRQLALEWAGRGVRSNAVGPGLIHTPMTETAYADDTSRTAREGVVPIGRIGTPQDIADAVAWFAGDRSSYVTGQEILVDGGLGGSVLSHIPRITPG